ncbi:hypothetical protein Hanom_Chr03g00219241 [Helianthus anomalus]
MLELTCIWGECHSFHPLGIPIGSQFFLVRISIILALHMKVLSCKGKFVISIICDNRNWKRVVIINKHN